MLGKIRINHIEFGQVRKNSDKLGYISTTQIELGLIN